MAVGGAFPDRKTISELTAKMLLEVDAVVSTHQDAETGPDQASEWDMK